MDDEIMDVEGPNKDTATTEQSQTRREDDEDGSICPICLDSWTNCGEHRVCSLKCGHLFGHKCIIRWLESQSSKKCPTCKTATKKSDLRFIYAKKLIAIDNMELEHLRVQLEDALAKKEAALQSVSKYVTREHVYQLEIEQLKSKIHDLNGRLSCASVGVHVAINKNISRLKLYLEKNLEICPDNQCKDCRVFDISVPRDYMLIASRSTTALFNNYGLKQISLPHFKSVKFIPLHQSPIKDMCIDTEVDRVLTVSTDKTFKVTDGPSFQASRTRTLDFIPWACSWNPGQSEELFVGSQNGFVNLYDLRCLDRPKLTLTIEGDFSPVVSICAVRESKFDVVLVTKLNSIWAFERLPDGSYSRHSLPLEGPFVSTRYNDETQQFLVSSRPNSQTSFARHTLCYLEKVTDPETITCSKIHTLRGGNTVKLLAKTSCFLPNGIVAGHHENRKSILLYNSTAGEEIGSCPTHDNLVLDIRGMTTSSGSFLAYLNERKMEIFKFN